MAWKSTGYCVCASSEQKNARKAADAYCREEYAIVKEKLEDILGVAIINSAIKESIAVYNENRAACRRFSDIAARYPGNIRPSDRHAVFKSQMVYGEIKTYGTFE